MSETADKAKTDHIDRPLGERLRLERDARRMTRAVLAARLDVSESTIQHYEDGDVRVPAARLWQICRLLDIEVAAIFEGLPHHVEAVGESAAERGAGFVHDDGKGRRVSALARQAARLPDAQLDIAVDLIRALKPKRR